MGNPHLWICIILFCEINGISPPNLRKQSCILNQSSRRILLYKEPEFPDPAEGSDLLERERTDSDDPVDGEGIENAGQSRESWYLCENGFKKQYL